MDTQTDHYFHALILILFGFASLGYGVFLERIRAWRIGRFRRESGADLEQVRAWFRPSHDAFSDLFARTAALAAAYPALLFGAGLICNGLNIERLPTPAWVSPVLSYSLGASVFVVFSCLTLLFLVSAERIAGGYVLSALPRHGYDYAKAERSVRSFGRSGPVFSVMSRLFSLIMLAVTWFIGSMIADDIAPHLHTWLGQ